MMGSESTKYKIRCGEDLIKYINISGKMEIPLDLGLCIDEISIGVGTKNLKYSKDTHKGLTEDMVPDYLKYKEVLTLLKDAEPEMVEYYEKLIKGYGYCKSYMKYKYRKYTITRNKLGFIIDALMVFASDNMKTKDVFFIVSLIHGGWEYNIVITRAREKNTEDMFTSTYCYGGNKHTTYGNDPQFIRDIKRIDKATSLGVMF